MSHVNNVKLAESAYLFQYTTENNFGQQNGAFTRSKFGNINVLRYFSTFSCEMHGIDI